MSAIARQLGFIELPVWNRMFLDAADQFQWPGLTSGGLYWESSSLLWCAAKVAKYFKDAQADVH